MSFLDLIGRAEGTDKGRGYNETLGYGAYTNGPRELTSMSLDDIRQLQNYMLVHPQNYFNSSALGRYQIVGKTLDGLRAELGLTGQEKFTPELQDRLATTLAQRRGNDPAGLRNEWEGLRRIPDAEISAAFGNFTPGGGLGTRIENAVVAKNAPKDDSLPPFPTLPADIARKKVQQPNGLGERVFGVQFKRPDPAKIIGEASPELGPALGQWLSA